MEEHTLSIGGSSYTITVKTDWADKDGINFGDFNRIEQNVVTTKSYLTALQYSIPELTTVTNRTKTFIEYLSSINRIEELMETIRLNFFTPVGYPGTETWAVGKSFDFNEANRIEKNIKLLFLSAGLVAESLIRCGTINAGYARGDLVVY
jgi:hypothetical protein